MNIVFHVIGFDKFLSCSVGTGLGPVFLLVMTFMSVSQSNNILVTNVFGDDDKEMKWEIIDFILI